jgi:hypothetical protein
VKTRDHLAHASLDATLLVLAARIAPASDEEIVGGRAQRVSTVSVFCPLPLTEELTRRSALPRHPRRFNTHQIEPSGASLK